MAEVLSVDDVALFTDGRLPAAPPAAAIKTQMLLDAARERVRTFCGWHVSPVQQDTVTLRGSGFDWLILPTLKIVDIISVTEDGVAIDPDDLYILSGEPGIIYKNSGCWTGRKIEVVFAHGFTAAEAADWRDAILSFIDAASATIGTGGIGPITGLEVDDISLRWSGLMDRSWGIAKNPLFESVLHQYKLRMPWA